MVDDFEFRGEVVQAIHIGRFRVIVCCGTTKHAVVHAPTGRVLMCGFTQQQAVRVADTASIYADGEKVVAPRILFMWVREVLRGSEERFEDFSEQITGERPRPVQDPGLGRGAMRRMAVVN